jgi:hypothetical protein
VDSHPAKMSKSILNEITESCKQLLAEPDLLDGAMGSAEIEREIRKLQERLPHGV